MASDVVLRQRRALDERGACLVVGEGALPYLKGAECGNVTLRFIDDSTEGPGSSVGRAED